MSLRTPTFDRHNALGFTSFTPTYEIHALAPRQYAGRAADRSGSLLPEHINALRESFRTIGESRPIAVDAICVLPDHLHLLTTLPREDADFATRIMLIKQGFSRWVPQGERISASRASKGKRGLWRRRYWEHLVRDEATVLSLIAAAMPD